MKNYSSKKTVCFVLLTVFLAIACNMSKIKINDLPVPPSAVQGNKYPEFGTQMHNSINAAAPVINENIGKFDEKLFTLSPVMTWQELSQFYDVELQGKGLSRKNKEPIETSDSQILIYQPEGTSENKGVAIVRIETSDYTTQEKYYFLLLCTSAK
jgi:hypothetical protein